LILSLGVSALFLDAFFTCAGVEVWTLLTNVFAKVIEESREGSAIS